MGATIFIADDHALFRQSFKRIILENKRVSVVREARDGRELLALIETEVPDVVILDIEMPGMDGIQLCGRIRERYPEVKVMVISMHEEKMTIGHALKMGASAYVPKAADVTEFELALDAIIANKPFRNALMDEALKYTDQVENATPENFHKATLSPQQLAIIALVCKQLTNKEIALQLSLSEHTVRNHKVRLMRKLNVKNVQGLVKFAVENGLNHNV